MCGHGGDGPVMGGAAPVPRSPIKRSVAKGNTSLEMFQMIRVEKLFTVCSAFFLPALLGGHGTALARQGGQSRAQRSVAASKAVKVSDGLKIQLVADDDLVPDCTTIATDSGGRVLVSGPRYLCELLDQDKDGIYDARRLIVEAPSHGAHGLCIDGDTLYYVGDNGVWKIDQFAKASANGVKPVRVLEIKTGGEHDAHALRKGPDGFWYLIAGNGTKGSFGLQNVKTPRIPNPRAGVLWRISPDWSEREVWAQGFRNAYDFDFGPDHTIDTFDSDGERDISLPWYRPTRVFRVRQGHDAGWVSRSWKRSNADPMMPAVLAELGRGSPTGVLRSPGERLPARFEHGVYVLDWTFGRVVFVSDHGKTELVASPAGNEGFAVTDIAAASDGALLVSVGGRRSRGGVYRIDALKPLASTKISKFHWDKPIAVESSTITEALQRLRRNTDPLIDQTATSEAVSVLASEDASQRQVLDAVTLLIESLGGLGPGDPKDARGKQQAAAVFDSCRGRIRPKIEPEIRDAAVAALLSRVQRLTLKSGKELVDDPEGTKETQQSDEVLCRELIRGLAVLEPESSTVFKAIADDMDRVRAPVDKLFRLIALARIPVRRSDDMTERIAEAMVSIPVLVKESELNVDRNWTPRMGELFLAMQHRDSLLPSRIVSNPAFGDAAHLVWTEKMDPENLERARHKCLMQSRGKTIDPSIARFIALGPDAVPRNFVYQWLKDDATRSAAWLALASHPVPRDVADLQQAALSVDKVVRDAAVAALKRLGADVPEHKSDSASIQEWLKRAEAIMGLNGKVAAGQKTYSQRQCALCHNGGKALGPSLSGVSKRFSAQDLFRATVDPSHAIPDRYRAKQVLTVDGEVVVGLVVYESVDGVTLMASDGHTKRVNVDEIQEMRLSEVSLMPEGLLLGLSDQEVADLLAYLGSL
jgi:putative heme-binding domain-containing protein